MSRSARLRTLAVAAALPVLVGVAGAAIALRAFAADTVPMGPFDVRLAASFGAGDTTIALPPLGRLEADTHFSPIDLRATLEEVDITSLQESLRTGDGLDGVAETVELAAYDRLPWFTLRVLVIGGLGSALAAATILRRRRAIEIGAAAGFLAVVTAVGFTAVTFDARALLAPAYTGTLSLAPELFGPVEATLQRVDHFRNELRQLVAGASRAYAAVEANPLGAGDELRVLHISDIHLSTLGYDFAIEVARSFDVDLVIDTGDTSSFGTEAESLILSAVPRFGRPYVYVRGNHDSIGFQRAVEAIDLATVLDGRVATVEGLDIYGLGDPYFVGRRGTPLPDDAVAELVRSVQPRIRSDVAALARPPDVVAVHDQRMAEGVAGYVPLVISGHFHVATAAVSEGTIFLKVGTTGGAGPTAVTAEGDQPLSAQILYFRPSDDGDQRLVAWDLITQAPDTGTLEIRRHLVDAELGSPVPSPPAPTRPEPTVTTGVAGPS